MERRVMTLMLAFGLLLAPALPAAAAGGAATDRVEGPIESVVLIGEDPLTIGLMSCDFVNRVEKPDGSATETQSCTIHTTLSDAGDGELVPCADCLPETAVVAAVGGCEWASDYWLTETGVPLFAESVRVVVTPSGNVQATSRYAADPPGLAECFGA